MRSLLFSGGDSRWSTVLMRLAARLRLFLQTVQAGYVVPALLAVGAFMLYRASLVPGVLSGDAGELAYHPLILGIPHPTGYPLYLLLGKLWLLVAPAGEPAWQMNLFSALWGALAVGWFTALLWRRLPAWAAVTGGVALAVTPDVWRYSTETAVYSLHVFLIVLTLERFERWMAARERGDDGRGPARWTFFALGLGVANHPTFIVVAAGLAFVWIVWWRRAGTWYPQFLLTVAWPAIIPVLLYLYLPLRASVLLGPNPFEYRPLTPAFTHGLVSPFYEEGVRGLWRYVTGRSLLPGFRAEGWVALPALWVQRIFRPLGVGWGVLILAGFLALLRTQRAAALGLMLAYGLGGTLALKYWQDFAAVGWIAHLAGHLMLVHVLSALLVAAGAVAVARIACRLGTRLTSRQRVARLATVAVVVFLFVPPIFSSISQPPADSHVESRSIQTYWDRALRQPLAHEAALMAHWGDLTPFWYQQYALGRRTDLVGIFPPSVELAEAWLATGRALYLAGPILENLPLTDHFRAIPDGLFVRLERGQHSAERRSVPTNYELGTGQSAEKEPGAGAPRFSDGLLLISADLPTRWTEGERSSTTLIWHAETKVPRDLLLSMQLVDENGRVAAEWAPRFASLWYPRSELPAAQQVISRPELTLPWGIRAGRYTLTLSVYDPDTSRTWSSPAGSTVHGWPLGAVTITPSTEPPNVETLRASLNGGVIAAWPDGLRLYSVTLPESSRGVYPGQNVPVTLVWQLGTHGWADREALARVVRLSLVAADGKAVQSWEVPLSIERRWAGPIAGLRRDLVSLPLGASVPADTYTLHVEVLDETGRPQTARLGWWRRTRRLSIGTVRVEARQRTYQVPDELTRVGAVFGESVELVGYTLADARLTLAWRADEPVPLELHVFVHILDEEGNLVGQADHEPQAGRAPTSGWLPGEVVVDEVRLPVTPAAGWRLRVGLYDPGSGARLLRADGIPSGDAVELTIQPPSTPFGVQDQD